MKDLFCVSELNPEKNVKYCGLSKCCACGCAQLGGGSKHSEAPQAQRSNHFYPSFCLMTQQVIVFFQQCPDLAAFKYPDTWFFSYCCITTKGLIWILFSTASGQHHTPALGENSHFCHSLQLFSSVALFEGDFSSSAASTGVSFVLMNTFISDFMLLVIRNMELKQMVGILCVIWVVSIFVREEGFRE